MLYAWLMPELSAIDDEDLDKVPRPDVSQLVTEDDTPVDNPFSEKQMRLLVAILYASWNPGRPFVAMANVAVYMALNRPPTVPDVLVATDVQTPPDLMNKEHRAFYAWLYGKAPDLAVEIVSNRKGGELTTKMKEYAYLGVRWYAVYDPARLIQKEALVCYQLTGDHYERLEGHFIPLGLGLVEWDGEIENHRERWIRWVDSSGQLLPTAEEKAAKVEAQNNLLAAKLRELGIDPESIAP